MQQETTSPPWLPLAAVLLLRLLFIIFYRIDSDEPQHLHVVWGWSQGLTPYRDVFDNHFPLLHLLFAPVMHVVPESSAVFLIMRLAIAPFALGAAWFVYRLAEPILGAKRAGAAALIFCVLPPWLPKSVEFRNDTLWIFFWLGALVLIAERRTPAFFASGVAFGLCVVASAKAAPLLLAHAAAFVSLRRMPRMKPLLRFAIGAAIPVAITAAFLYARGSLDAMIYATQRYNAAFPVPVDRRVTRAIIFFVAAPLLVLYARDERREREQPPPARHLILFALWYSFLVFAFWPVISPRDYLPLAPLAAMAIASANLTQRKFAHVLAATAVAAVWYAHLWERNDGERTRFVDAVAQLTTPNDFVYDLKGDAVFRPRPLYYVYERVGRVLTSNGTIRDDGPEEIVSHACCVAIVDSPHIPPRTRAFLQNNFLDAGALRVCGAIARDATFTIAIPQTYAIVARDPSHVVIDGLPYRGPRFLAAGEHTIARARNEPVAVVWSRAASGGVDANIWSRTIGLPRRDVASVTRVAQQSSLHAPPPH